MERAQKAAKERCARDGSEFYLVDSTTTPSFLQGPATTLYGHCINPRELVRTSDGFGADLIGERDIRGAMVLKVSAGSIADVAGLKHGDLVVEYDGHVIDAALTLGSAILESAPGSVVSV